MPGSKKQVRVNVRSRVNNDDIRRETRHGREKIIVPSATMPDDIVMNGIKYPSNEIEASFHTLDGTPAPLGHPTLDGNFLPASSTEAMIRNGIGAENENARREGGLPAALKVASLYSTQSRQVTPFTPPPACCANLKTSQQVQITVTSRATFTSTMTQSFWMKSARPLLNRVSG